MEKNITVLPGDGVGLEIVTEAVKVLEAVAQKYGHKFHCNYHDIGGTAIDKYGTNLPEETIKACETCDAVLLGGMGGPKWDHLEGEARADWPVLFLRKHFKLYANIRPVKLYNSLVSRTNFKPEVVRGVDMVVVRENTGGIFFGTPRKRWKEAGKRKAVDTMYYSEEEIERIVRVGFQLAQRRRKMLHSVDKMNAFCTSKLWREIATEVSSDYPDVQMEHILIDACAMRLIQNPTSFDVLVMENLFGDIISDEAAMLGGSLGMIGSAGIAGLPEKGKEVFGVFESAHGTAPSRAGQNIINPIAEINSAGLLLRYAFSLEAEADAIDEAITKVLNEYRTYDIMENEKRQVSTSEMGDLIAQEITMF